MVAPVVTPCGSKRISRRWILIGWPRELSAGTIGSAHTRYSRPQHGKTAAAPFQLGMRAPSTKTSPRCSSPNSPPATRYPPTPPPQSSDSEQGTRKARGPSSKPTPGASDYRARSREACRLARKSLASSRIPPMPAYGGAPPPEDPRLSHPLVPPLRIQNKTAVTGKAPARDPSYPQRELVSGKVDRAVGQKPENGRSRTRDGGRLGKNLQRHSETALCDHQGGTERGRPPHQRLVSGSPARGNSEGGGTGGRLHACGICHDLSANGRTHTLASWATLESRGPNRGTNSPPRPGTPRGPAPLEPSGAEGPHTDQGVGLERGRSARPGQGHDTGRDRGDGTGACSTASSAGGSTRPDQPWTRSTRRP